MFYLTMHSTHYIYSYIAQNMVKDHSDSKRGNLLPQLHVLLYLISSKGSFICTIRDRIAHTTAFVTLLPSPSIKNSCLLLSLPTYLSNSMVGMRNSSMGPP